VLKHVNKIVQAAVDDGVTGKCNAITPPGFNDFSNREMMFYSPIWSKDAEAPDSCLRNRTFCASQGKVIIRFHKIDIPSPETLTILTRLRNHRIRDLNPQLPSWKRSPQWDGKPANSRPKIKRGLIVKLSEVANHRGNDSENIFSTALEEFFPVSFDILFSKFLVRKHSEIGILLSPLLPMVIRVVH